MTQILEDVSVHRTLEGKFARNVYQIPTGTKWGLVVRAVVAIITVVFENSATQQLADVSAVMGTLVLTAVNVILGTTGIHAAENVNVVEQEQSQKSAWHQDCAHAISRGNVHARQIL